MQGTCLYIYSNEEIFTFTEERDCKEAICYPEEDESATMRSKNPSAFSPNEIHPATNTSQFSDERM